MSTSVRSRFEGKLAELDERVISLGSEARQAVAKSVKALLEGDADQAREIIAEDIVLNRLRFDIEQQCYALIATEQPVASDLRAIVSALMSVTDLERIADHGKKIARTYLRMLEDPQPLPADNIRRLSQVVVNMVDRALQAYEVRDPEEARAVCKSDEEADALYKQTFNVLLAHMLENPRLIGAGTHLLQVAHELERVGDRATNVSERVIYAVTGQLGDLNT